MRLPALIIAICYSQKNMKYWEACQDDMRHAKSYNLKEIAPDYKFPGFDEISNDSGNGIEYDYNPSTQSRARRVYHNYAVSFSASRSVEGDELTAGSIDLSSENQAQYELRSLRDTQVKQVCVDQEVEFLKLNTDMPNIILPEPKKRITLVLDMDETLFNRPEDISRGHKITFINPVGDEETHYVRARPYLMNFLHYVSEHADLVLMTMSTKSRAEAILYNFQVRYRFSRLVTHFDMTEDTELPKVHVKPIQKMFDESRTFKNVLHIDDRPGTFLLNQLNGLRIRKYTSEDNDRQLLEFKKILNYIFKCFDVTEDVRDCVADLKTKYRGDFDGYWSDEYKERAEDEYVGLGQILDRTPRE
eukprot:NODE_394_length_9435_cov_0.160347.p3 type:complete len:360 gc:universal NODE_394_length_9435_cov_0.160347:3278-4357(+)